jgi:hypothetical protein
MFFATELARRVFSTKLTGGVPVGDPATFLSVGRLPPGDDRYLFGLAKWAAQVRSESADS